jgi:hypothetical protein
MFKQFFPSGDLATRDCVLKFHTIASGQVCINLGVVLTLDDHGDPIIVVTRIRSLWSPLGTLKFASLRLTSQGWSTTNNASNRAAKNYGLGYLKDITRKRCATIIPNGSSPREADNAALGKAYLACPHGRDLDNLLLHALLIRTASDLYEAALEESNAYLTIPTDLI